MLLGIHTFSFREKFRKEKDFNIFKAIEMSAEMGFECMEILTGKANMPPEHIGSEKITEIRKIIKYAEKFNIKILCFSTFNDFAYVKDEEWRLANVAYIKKWLKIAGTLGVPNIRMLTCYYIKGENPVLLERLTLEGIKECIPFAEKYKVNMAIENHNSIFFTGQEILNLIKIFKSKRLTACPDPTNWCKCFFEKNCTLEEKERVFKNLSLVVPKATNAHFKVKGVKGNKLIGYEDDLKRLLKIYIDAGYKGGLMFESINKRDLLKPLKKAREIVEKTIKELKEER